MERDNRIKRGQLVSILNHKYLYGLVIQNDIKDNIENIVIIAGILTSCKNTEENFYRIEGTNITLDMNKLFSVPKSDIDIKPLKVLDNIEMNLISKRLKLILGIKTKNIVVSDFLDALHAYYKYYESLNSDTIEDNYYRREVFKNIETQIDNLMRISNYTKPEIYEKLRKKGD